MQTKDFVQTSQSPHIQATQLQYVSTLKNKLSFEVPVPRNSRNSDHSDKQVDFLFCKEN